MKNKKISNSEKIFLTIGTTLLALLTGFFAINLYLGFRTMEEDVIFISGFGLLGITCVSIMTVIITAIFQDIWKKGK